MQRRQLVGNHLFTLQQMYPCWEHSASPPSIPDYNSRCLEFFWNSHGPPLLPLQYQPAGCRHGLGSNATIEMRLETMKHHIIKPNSIKLHNSHSPVIHSLLLPNAWCLDVPGLLAWVQSPYQAWCGTAQGVKSCSCLKCFISSQETHMCGTKLQ